MSAISRTPEHLPDQLNSGYLRAVVLTDAHRRLSLAPMMELTDRHCRYLFRLLSQHALLYTEMLTSRAVLHGDQQYLLGCNEIETPVVLQLGGSDPMEMAEAATIGESWGYSEINMNVGCPSDRVQSGRFGACLMAEPALVARNVRAMQEAVQIPVSVKCRLGIDRDERYDVLENFVAHVRDAGCRHVVVHARKAWLDGLSPKENRTVPPLRYDFVYRLKQRFPELHITINGGIDSWQSIDTHLSHVDAVMLGRKAYYDPAFLCRADSHLFADFPDGLELAGDMEALSTVARDYARYVQMRVGDGVKPSALLRHLVALFQEVPGARLWRRHISEQANKTADIIAMVDEALLFVEQRAAV